MFSLGARLTSRIESRREARNEDPEGGVLNLLVALVFDVLFRAPVIGIVGGIVVLLAVGSVHGSQSGTNAGCVLRPISSAGTLDVITAAVLVLATMAAVTGFLQGGTQLAAGQIVKRTKPDKDEKPKKPLSPVLVVLSMIVALIVSFAALYAAFVARNGGVAASPCRFNMADALYFSASVGATAGFGDISPTSTMLRLVTSAQLVIFFAALAIFLQMLWARPEKTG